MIRGLEITIRGDELSRRISERVDAHMATASALEARIAQRDGDMPFDVRPEDGFKTLTELERERQQYRDRISQLTLLRDNLVADERYVLGRRDLRLAELISTEATDAFGTLGEVGIDESARAAVEGLKLTISGEELHDLLERRIRDHRGRAERWRRELAGTPEPQTDEHPSVPDNMCEHEAERHEWRVDVLRFIRDHIEATEIYRLSESDLAFGELLPEKPGSLEQEEFEERTSVGFQLERLTKRLGEFVPCGVPGTA